MNENKKRSQRPLVYGISIALLAVLMIACVASGDTVNTGISNVSGFLLTYSGWLYVAGVLVFVVISLLIFVSPLAKVRIGGSKAKKMINPFSFFAIVICTIVGAGLPTWACAEAMQHFSAPPSEIAASTADAANFAMETTMMHWSFGPLATYSVPIILFAFLLYNRKSKLRIASMIEPALGRKLGNGSTSLIDGITVFVMVCGISSGIGVAVDSLTSGLSSITNGAITKNAVTITIIMIFAVTLYTFSSVTGLTKGIKLLSNVNIWMLCAITACVLLLGPTMYCLNLGVETTGAFLNNFVSEITKLRTFSGDTWAYSWPVYYFAFYLSWSLISCVFIGRAAYGFTVKEILVYGYLLPSSFIVVWIWAFSGSALFYETNAGGLVDAYNNQGYASVVFKVFEQLPAGVIIMAAFVFVVYLSLVTSCDSCTNAIASLCTDESEEEETMEPPKQAKIFWGVLIGVAAWGESLFMDVSGLKAVVIIGGLPSLVITLFGVISLWKIMWHPARYDTFKEDYDEYGRPVIAVKEELDYSQDYEGEKRKAGNLVYALTRKTTESGTKQKNIAD